MVPESAFTEEVKSNLLQLNLTLEMAVAKEWVVRDNDIPDRLEVVYVFRIAHYFEDEMGAACSCTLGAKDEPCPHALEVFNEVRANPHILRQILKGPQPSPVGT